MELTVYDIETLFRSAELFVGKADESLMDIERDINREPWVIVTKIVDWMLVPLQRLSDFLSNKCKEIGVRYNPRVDQYGTHIHRCESVIPNIIAYAQEHDLSYDAATWPDDHKILFKLTHGGAA